MKRRYELDICRIFACCMVVMLHVAVSDWNRDPSSFEWKVYNLANASVRAGVPLFFMISGTLFLEKENFSIKYFVRKNICRLLSLYIIWSLLYECNAERICHSYENIYDFLVGSVKGYYHLWFLPAMTVAYFFLPVVYGVMKGRKIAVQYLLILFAVMTLLERNVSLIPDLPVLIRAVCDNIDLSNISYLGYMILGYVLSRKTYSKKVLLAMPVIYLLESVLAAYGNLWYSLREGEAAGWLFGNFTFMTFIQACCIFIFFQGLKNREIKHSKALVYFSECTLGVYLLHPMVLEYWERHGVSVASFNPVISVPFIFLLVVCTCAAAVSVMKRIPCLRKIV